tara:strand:- start:4878 stop:5876 length:999 start_codon:yes stop_codon:yes gene_type:complete
MNKETVLITGVAGLLGSRMAEYLLERGYDVIGVDDLSGGYKENIPDRVEFFEMDVLSDDISDIFDKYNPNVVYHFAAYAAECLSPFIRKYNYTSNLTATANIVNNCIVYNVDRLVFTSSIAVYGDQQPPFNEDMDLKPKDPYGVAKAACERDIQIAGEQHGLDWCIIRPHNVYGVKQNIWDKYRNVLGIWMYQKLNGERISIFGDGEQTRAFSYIDDCLESFWKCGFSDLASKQIFNIGGTKEYSINTLANTLSEVVGGIDIDHFEPRHEVKHAFPTYDKSVDILGYCDTIPLKEGVSKMWEWAKSQPSRKRQSWDKYEIDDGIYDYWKSKK